MKYNFLHGIGFKNIYYIENHELEFRLCNELKYPPKYHAISKYSDNSHSCYPLIPPTYGRYIVGTSDPMPG
jgi:hypothetical protein